MPETLKDWALDRLKDAAQRLESGEIEVRCVNDISDLTELPPKPDAQFMEHQFTGDRQLIFKYVEVTSA